MPSRRSFLRSGAFISIVLGFGAIGLTLLASLIGREGPPSTGQMISRKVLLPKPRTNGPLSVEQAILRRRSRREYTKEPLKLSDVGQLLWSAQGVTAPHLWTGLRTAPSAGGLYPLETYLVVRPGGVEDLEAGIYRYDPHLHELNLVTEGDHSSALMSACVDQEWVGAAAINIVFTAVVERTRVRYGDRALQYVFQESGHAAQNVYLQAEALGLGCVVIGAFYEDEVRSILKASRKELPVYVIPVGRPA
ncbi:MAG: SagB/ThcOx family dehydrogenase [Thaumarchaeota archaeon]|nr:SagB/ThcOx family dehydrogenase [Candidatus Calditenuaceae archaeon]MDW8042102.1 SagB/ThcOx family dehydrogenase [Nitrososphaerota archaeon]